MTHRILVTGGPVHGYVDDVKIITNKFRGGLMVKLAEELAEHHEVVWIGPKGYPTPKQTIARAVIYPSGSISRESVSQVITVIYHDGIDDYMNKVLEIAPTCDGVVLGAAVANLIPAERIHGKFPSHNYKPGDIIPIDFKIAPRIIDDVKKVAPNTKLFGFKLLAGVTDEELVRAAYGVLLESKSTLVFANRDKDLARVKVITKERGVIEDSREGLCGWIDKAIQDRYYRTVSEPLAEGTGLSGTVGEHELFDKLVREYGDKFSVNPEGYMFGTIAVRNPRKPGFLTTGRGKNELADRVFVKSVDHQNLIVTTAVERKATLNAPLLDTLFDLWPMASAIVHWHAQEPNGPTLP